ncbi:hypothetical protein C4573_01325 [Candidatus Woesearchaeota archaeon]|nr:MAG: hypothetical protein C4573_01325 [Candidatus Woesearchaeota archaeon]
MEKPKIPSVNDVLGRKLPEKTFRASPVSATIWTNEFERDGKQSTYQTVVVERSYKDKNNAWQKTSTFRIADLPKVALVVTKAYEYLALSDTDTIEEEDW